MRVRTVWDVPMTEPREPIPTAVARGADAQTPGAVRPLRAGLFAGGLAALFVLVTFVFAQLPDRALSLVGADSSEVGRHGGMRLVWVPPPGADLARVEQTFHGRHAGARVSRAGEALVVEVARVVPEDVEVAAELVARGGLAFHRVVITPAMPELASAYGVPLASYQDPQASAAVRLEVDHWQPEDGGTRKTDHYLIGARQEEIAAAVAAAQAKGWALPDGTHLAYELVEVGNGTRLWRSYVIETQPALTGEHIANAVGSFDPNTNAPVVLLDFTREGAELFARVTEGMVGDKLATLLGDVIVSAPIINGPIRGGRASITMGGDPDRQGAQRDALVAALRAGSLPEGGTLREATYIGPTVTSLHEWLARVLLSLIAGLIVGLVAWALVRTTHPVWRTPEVRVPGAVSWARLAVLLIAPIAVVGASKIIAPGIDPEVVHEITDDTSFFSLGMLGLSPLIASFVLVELVATIVPSWRARRHAGPAARLPIDVAMLATAIVLALVQGWFAARYLEALEASPLGLDRLLFLASLAAATLGFAFVAWIVRVYGAGNGYAALLVSGFVWAAYKKLVVAPEWSSSFSRDIAGWADRSETYLALIAMIVPAIGMVAVLRLRIVRAGEAPLRVPASGMAPIGEVRGLLAFLLAALGMIPIHALAAKIAAAQAWFHDLSRVVVLAIVAAFAVLWSWTFARPGALRPFAERAGLAAPSQESWRSATILTVGVLVVVAAGYALLGAYTWTGMAGTITSVFFAAFVLDVRDDLRGRRGRLAYVWSLQSAQHADIAAHVLDKEQIGFHLAGTNLRTMLAWFGPFAPIDVWVRREDVERARTALAKVFAAK